MYQLKSSTDFTENLSRAIKINDHSANMSHWFYYQFERDIKIHCCCCYCMYFCGKLQKLRTQKWNICSLLIVIGIVTVYFSFKKKKEAKLPSITSDMLRLLHFAQFYGFQQLRLCFENYYYLCLSTWCHFWLRQYKLTL